MSATSDLESYLDDLREVRLATEREADQVLTAGETVRTWAEEHPTILSVKYKAAARYAQGLNAIRAAFETDVLTLPSSPKAGIRAGQIRFRKALRRRKVLEAGLAVLTTETISLPESFSSLIQRGLDISQEVGDQIWERFAQAVRSGSMERARAQMVHALNVAGEQMRLIAAEADCVREGLERAIRSQITPDGAAGHDRAEYIFRREQDFWKIRFENEAGVLRGKKGFEYIAVLLRTPGKPVQVTALEEEDGSKASSARSVVQPHEVVEGDDEEIAGYSTGSYQSVLDSQAKREYENRLQTLASEIKDANRHGDIETATKLQEEFEFVHIELRTALGLGGRDRALKGWNPIDAAYQSVRRALNRAVKYLREVDPPLKRLASHLNTEIQYHKGYFVYCPDPRRAPPWVL